MNWLSRDVKDLKPDRRWPLWLEILALIGFVALVLAFSAHNIHSGGPQ